MQWCCTVCTGEIKKRRPGKRQGERERECVWLSGEQEPEDVEGVNSTHSTCGGERAAAAADTGGREAAVRWC